MKYHGLLLQPYLYQDDFFFFLMSYYNEQQVLHMNMLREAISQMLSMQSISSFLCFRFSKYQM